MASRLPSDLDPFLKSVVLPHGWRVAYAPSVTSTMDVAREAARRGLTERLAFVTEYQSEGRGRRGRLWLAPPGKALLMSLLLPLGGEPLQLSQLVSVALCQALESQLGLEPQIKWPNDVLVHGRKVAGVLAEALTGPESGGEPDQRVSGYVIVGCGINVNLDPFDLKGLPESAGSLQIAAGRPVHRGELLVVFLERLDGWLNRPAARRSVSIRGEWQRRLWHVSQPVRAEDGGQEIEGIVEGCDPDGALLLRLENGELRRIVAGELIL